MVTLHSGLATTTAFEIRFDHKLLHKFVEFAPKYGYKVREGASIYDARKILGFLTLLVRILCTVCPQNWGIF